MADESLRIKVGADVSDFDKGIKKVNESLGSFEKSTVKTGATLTNLSRIASDAPFGFIAIQNNLDPLIQSFGSLSKESGGTGNAIKALAGSLVGPAGLALGFSVVTALVTSAIQKYGSLSNAVSEFASSSDLAAVNQRKLNGAISESIAANQGEINSLKNYIDILSNSDKPQQDRINAYNILKKEFPAVIQNLTLENALTAQGGLLIQERSKQLISYIELKGKEKALITLIEKEYEGQAKTLQSANNLIQDQNTFLNKFINVAAGGGFAFIGLSRRINGFSKEVDKSNQSVGFFEKSLKSIQEQIAGTGAEILDPQSVIKATKDAAKAAEDLQKKLETARIQSDKKVVKEREKEAKAEYERALQRLINFQSVQAQIGKQMPKIGATQIQTPILLDFEQQDRANRLIAQGAAIQKKNLEDLKSQVELTAQAFGEFLNPVIDQFFSNIASGENVFKGLGDLIKRFVTQAIANLVKLAAAAAFLSIASGGTISFGTAFKIVSSGSKLPNFGGISPNNMALNVSGQFAVRGTDLVAVLNQSQQRINRVG